MHFIYSILSNGGNVCNFAPSINPQKSKDMKLKFYRCRSCGNIIVKIVDSGVNPVCCGESMQELRPNLVEASQEKHLPVVTDKSKCAIKVQVGSVPHPMTPEHHIEFIALETETGIQVVRLSSEGGPHACFAVRNTPKAIYEYCNLHGLWKTELQEV